MQTTQQASRSRSRKRKTIKGMKNREIRNRNRKPKRPPRMVTGQGQNARKDTYEIKKSTVKAGITALSVLLAIGVYLYPIFMLTPSEVGWVRNLKSVFTEQEKKELLTWQQSVNGELRALRKELEEWKTGQEKRDEQNVKEAIYRTLEMLKKEGKL